MHYQHGLGIVEMVTMLRLRTTELTSIEKWNLASSPLFCVALFSMS